MNKYLNINSSPYLVRVSYFSVPGAYSGDCIIFSHDVFLFSYWLWQSLKIFIAYTDFWQFWGVLAGILKNASLLEFLIIRLELRFLGGTIEFYALLIYWYLYLSGFLKWACITFVPNCYNKNYMHMSICRLLK